jgi:hypothetical protein
VSRKKWDRLSRSFVTPFVTVLGLLSLSSWSIGLSIKFGMVGEEAGDGNGWS